MEIQEKKRDYRSLILTRIYSLHNKLINCFSTFWCRTKMSFWGIKYGQGSSFRGNMIFYRSPGTIIEMGDGCRFNSNSRFNFRGINHPCILQTIVGGV